MSYDLEHHEGFVGHLIALEGVSDSVTMIHGPTGCKFHPSDFSERVFVDRNGDTCARNVFMHDDDHHLGQPRIPCTAVGGDGVISGAMGRSESLYRALVDTRPSLIGVVNSPGMSLIGENIRSLKSDVPTVIVDSCDYSATVYSGFDDCVKKILDVLTTKKLKKRSVVNIIGLSLFHQRAFDNAEEIRRILSLCKIKINCFVCAGSSSDEIRKIPSAELNIVIDPDFGIGTAEYCLEKFGIPYIVSTPVGFDGTEKFIIDVCERMHSNPERALDDLREWRAKTAKMLVRAEKRFVRMRGRTFSVKSTPTVGKSLSEFIHSYLGLIPLALDCGEKMDEFDGIDVSDDFWNTRVDVAYCSGNESASMVQRNVAKGAVEICEPFKRQFNIRSAPFFGTIGAVLLIENTINVLCGIRND